MKPPRARSFIASNESSGYGSASFELIATMPDAAVGVVSLELHHPALPGLDVGAVVARPDEDEHGASA